MLCSHAASGAQSRMTRGFILLATQRTGSSWVQEMLNSHPDLKVYNELFLRDAEGVPIWEPSDVVFANTFLAERARGPARLTRGYWTMRYLRYVYNQPDVRGVGFKYMYDQVPHSRAVLPYAAIARVPVVHILRRNLLDIVISAKAALASGFYHLPSDGRPDIPWQPSSQVDQRITLDPSEVLEDLTRLSHERRRFQRWLRLTRTPTCEVEYEALTVDRSQFGRILAFLGLPAEQAELLNSGLKKIRSSAQAETITNFSDIERRLRGTPFQSYLQS